METLTADIFTVGNPDGIYPCLQVVGVARLADTQFDLRSMSYIERNIRYEPLSLDCRLGSNDQGTSITVDDVDCVRERAHEVLNAQDMAALEAVEGAVSQNPEYGFGEGYWLALRIAKARLARVDHAKGKPAAPNDATG